MSTFSQISSARNIVWPVNPTTLELEIAFTSLIPSDASVILDILRGDRDIPMMDGLSEYQQVNLLRQLLRKLLGDEKFYEVTSLAGTSTVNAQKVVGTAFETIVEKYLRENNISFKTEEDLKNEMANSFAPISSREFVRSWKSTGVKDFKNREIFTGPCITCTKMTKCPFKPSVGRAGPRCAHCRPNVTPDFVLTSDAFINGIKIKWIDCKAYYGSGSMGIVGEGSEQRIASDYTNVYGPGAVVFSFGYCCQLSEQFPDILLLDHSPLDLSDLITVLNEEPFRKMRNLKRLQIQN